MFIYYNSLCLRRDLALCEEDRVQQRRRELGREHRRDTLIWLLLLDRRFVSLWGDVDACVLVF